MDLRKVSAMEGTMEMVDSRIIMYHSLTDRKQNLLGIVVDSDVRYKIQGLQTTLNVPFH